MKDKTKKEIQDFIQAITKHSEELIKTITDFDPELFSSVSVHGMDPGILRDLEARFSTNGEINSGWYALEIHRDLNLFSTHFILSKSSKK